ncbi:MAG: hypothetical protein A2103_03590 [Gammaproteobacteria bacterium GWF2_41_13]|nr:MAG: hypothetical protein A2103_03590 [Gammaproteobacteria bacterium GWF2_41_13]
MILIEGLIGAGKTTLGELLEDRWHIPLSRELLDDNTLLILNRFYSEKQRWSFLSQVNFLINRLAMSLEMQLGWRRLLSDRSIFGDRIFAEMLYEEGVMTREEFSTYDKMFNHVLKIHGQSDLLIYVDCDVDVAISRISHRNRDCEKNISREYLIKLNKKYKSWFNCFHDAPKLLLNTNHVDIRTREGEAYILQLIEHEIDAKKLTIFQEGSSVPRRNFYLGKEQCFAVG